MKRFDGLWNRFRRAGAAIAGRATFRPAWLKVKAITVAVAQPYAAMNAEFPTVLGTGFFVSRSGIICTCRHVVELMQKLPVPKGYTGPRAAALVFKHDPRMDAWGWFPLELEVLGFGSVTPNPNYRGPDPPDVAYLYTPQVQCTPFVEIADSDVLEGESVAFGGFPMGTRLLTSPGWLHQVTPTLHSGLVGAILPFEGHQASHGFAIHANTQGGSSGSPVFGFDGRILGMVDSGPFEIWANDLPGQPAMVYKVPTSLTFCTSRKLLLASLKGAEEAIARIDGLGQRPEWDVYLERLSRKVRERGDGVLEPWQPARPD